MAVFDYVAIGADGKRATGVITADSPRAARKELRLRQLSPLDVKEARQKSAGRSGQSGSLSGNDLVLVTRQLAMFIKSGATVEEALGAIAGEAEKPSTRRVLMGVRGNVQEGYSFSEALSQASKAFPPYYRAVVSAGQSSGRLGEVMERLATHLEKSRKLRNKLLSALIYPAILIVVSIAVVVGHRAVRDARSRTSAVDQCCDRDLGIHARLGAARRASDRLRYLVIARRAEDAGRQIGMGPVRVARAPLGARHQERECRTIRADVCNAIRQRCHRARCPDRCERIGRQ